MKIIPIEGDQLINGEPQKNFGEILQEIVISWELSELRNDPINSTDGFVEVKRVTCVRGVYPKHLIVEWEIFHDKQEEGSQNDHPKLYGPGQLFIVFELCHSGQNLASFVFNNAKTAQSVLWQVSFI